MRDRETNYQTDRLLLLTTLMAKMADSMPSGELEEITVVINPQNIRIIAGYADGTPIWDRQFSA